MMGPKRGEKEIKDDQLHDSVVQLNATVMELQTRLDNSTTVNDIKHLTDAVERLSSKLDEMNVDTKLTELNNSIINIKDTLIENLVESNTKLTERVNNMEKKVTSMEKMVILTNQRSRENNIELSGIDDAVSDQKLQGVVKGILQKMDVECFDWDIQGCHRLPPRKGNSAKPTIVKFVNRKKPEEIMSRSKNLKNLDFRDLGLTSGNSIYVNINLSPAFKELNYFCRMLKKDGLVASVGSSHLHIKIKVSDQYFKINHVDDLKKLFPDRNFASRM